MSLPQKDEHICVNCAKTVDWTDNTKVWCGHKRRQKEGHCLDFAPSVGVK